MYYFIALSTFSSVLFAFLIARQWFEPEYDTIKYLIGWYGLKAYTKINKHVKKIYKIKQYIYDINDNTIDINFISNGEEVLKLSNNDLDLCKIKTYDFIFYEINTEDDQKYMVIKDKISKNVEDIEKSNVRFLAPQLTIDKSQTLIEFTQNIYLVGNKLFSRPFITWFMSKNKNILVDSNQEYSIRFLDNNMDFIQINSDQCIILGKDTFEIVKYERASDEDSEADSEAESEADASARESDEASACETDEASTCETDEASTCETDEEAESTCETDEEADTSEADTSEADTAQEVDLTLPITQ